jgi:hypothetical protein
MDWRVWVWVWVSSCGCSECPAPQLRLKFHQLVHVEELLAHINGWPRPYPYP